MKSYAIKVLSQQHWKIIKKMMKSSGVLVPLRCSPPKFEQDLHYAVSVRGYLKFMQKEEVIKREISTIQYWGDSTFEDIFFESKINPLKYPLLAEKVKTVKKFLKFIGDASKNKPVSHYIFKMEDIETQLNSGKSKKMEEKQYLDKLKNFMSSKCENIEVNKGMWRYTFNYTINGVKRKSSISRITAEQNMLKGKIPLTIRNILKTT
jgi:response regulator of citrate/malate metabolism